MHYWNIERMKQNDLFSTVERKATSGDTVTVLVHNVRSLPRHVDDILRSQSTLSRNIEIR